MRDAPTVAETRDLLQKALEPVRRSGRRIALVPTMGALHDGHRALIREARARVGDGGAVVVSVFVNPLQFGPHEDLERYPRTFDDDLAVCGAEGVDLVFAPSVEDMYPHAPHRDTHEPEVTLDPGPLGQVLEGAARPTHFRGVLVVVAKLFGLVAPDVAVFGEKDYQQLVLVRALVRDLCLGIDVVGAETVREEDGLALSSRNRYLDPAQRRAALALSRALRAAAAAAQEGADPALAAARGVLEGGEGVDVDYLVLTAPDLSPAPETGVARLLVAARVGDTRLIDNTALTLGAPSEEDPCCAR